MSKDIFIYTKETLIEKLREIRKKGMIKINFTVRRKYRDVPIVVVHET